MQLKLRRLSHLQPLAQDGMVCLLAVAQLHPAAPDTGWSNVHSCCSMIAPSSPWHGMEWCVFLL